MNKQVKTEIKDIILHNLQVLYEYNKATGGKNKYLSSSSFRSAILRKNVPKIDTIIDLCKIFNIETEKFLTKTLELKICIKGENNEWISRVYKTYKKSND